MNVEDACRQIGQVKQGEARLQLINNLLGTPVDPDTSVGKLTMTQNALLCTALRTRGLWPSEKT